MSPFRLPIKPHQQGPGNCAMKPKPQEDHVELECGHRERTVREWRAHVLTLVAIVMLVIFIMASGFGIQWGPLGQIDAALLSVDDAVYDKLSCSLAVRPASGRVVVVAIDQRSLDDPKLGRWPWKRSVHATLLDRLTAARAAAVLFDVGFIRATRDKHDLPFAEALRRNGVTALCAFEQYDEARHVQTPILPLPLFMDAARAVGFNLLKPPLVRTVQLVETSPPLDAFNSLVVEALCLLEHVDPNVVIAPKDDEIVVGPHHIPLQEYELLLNFRNEPPRQISYIDVLSGPLPDVAGRVVVVATTSDTKDLFAVPCTASGPGGSLPGGVILAMAIDDVLIGDSIRALPTWVGWQGVILIETIVLVVALRLRRPWLSVLLWFATPMLALGISWWAFNTLHIWVRVVAPLIAAKIASTLVYTDVLRTLSQRLATYLPTRVSEQVSRTGTLTSGDFEATILFQDVKGYTALSENLSPQEVRELMSRFFDLQQSIIARHGGFVVDYQGDAQMAMFGGDERVADHARQAVDAAWEILEALRGAGLRGTVEVDGQEMKFGIGINTGVVSVGTFGGDRNRQFSAIGDTTNVAARIQGLTRVLEWPLVVGAATFDAVSHAYDAECIADVVLRGRAAPVTVYKILGPKKR